jgi:hypothetical protein
MCFPKEFHNAFADFKRLFKKKTGIEWDHRLDRLKTTAEAFKYTPPEGGKPQGVMPMGWVPPEQANVGKKTDKAQEDEWSSDEIRDTETDPELVQGTDSSDESEDSGSSESGSNYLAVAVRAQGQSSAVSDDRTITAERPRRITLTFKKGNGLD